MGVMDAWKYKTVAMDPPWWESGGGGRGAQEHYPLVKTKDMPGVITSCPHWSNIADSAHLYMWTTSTFLANGESQWLAKELGFTPKTVLTWVKADKRLGLGYYFRGGCEYILFCAKGTARRGMAPRRTDIHAPRGKHSVKPQEAYDLIEAVSPGPYLELFAREERPMWSVWGNEIRD